MTEALAALNHRLESARAFAEVVENDGPRGEIEDVVSRAVPAELGVALAPGTEVREDVGCVLREPLARLLALLRALRPDVRERVGHDRS